MSNDIMTNVAFIFIDLQPYQNNLFRLSMFIAILADIDGAGLIKVSLSTSIWIFTYTRTQLAGLESGLRQLIIIMGGPKSSICQNGLCDINLNRNEVNNIMVRSSLAGLAVYLETRNKSLWCQY